MYRIQLVHTRESIIKCSLSPYIIISYGKNNVKIYNMLNEKIININGNNYKIEKIIKYLSHGIYYDELCMALKQELHEEYPETWISIAMQAGIIE